MRKSFFFLLLAILTIPPLAQAAEGAQSHSVWVQNNKPTAQAKVLIQTLQNASREGLDPREYHVEEILSAFREKRGADAGDLLTASFLSYASHMTQGRFPPKSMKTYWKRLPEVAKGEKEKSFKPLLLLESASDGKKMEKILNDLPPPHDGYQNLRKVLAQYRDLQSKMKAPWPHVESGPKVKSGETDSRVPLLAKRLEAEGYLKNADKKNVLEGDVEEALKLFQERHGLEADGTLGKETVAALNLPIEKRIRQIEANMDRWRWLPRDLGESHLFVNIPEFRLHAVEKGHSVLTMNVVTGQRRNWQTPLLSSQVSYLVLNPKWTVPPDIFKKEVIQHLRKEPNYLEKENMQVIGNEGVIDPATIDWNAVKPGEVSYRLVQRSGDRNALGRVKFLFYNPFAVYLHDTPQKKFFSRRMRALSHGCVRVEKPRDLAEYLMKDSPRWSLREILSAIDTGKTMEIPLPHPRPLHIFYLTVWVDEEGKIQFRDDVYGKDPA